MRKGIILISVVLLFCATHAQKMSLKYGNVTKDELTMTVYSADSSANAVVLFEDKDISYLLLGEDFILSTECEHKIKILNTAGTESANISIPYYSPSAVSGRGETISGIEAYSYNLEDGNIKKEKMDKKLIFDERINEYWKQIKFSIPSVKVGTVIEYKYLNESRLYHTIPDWIIQRSVPVSRAHLKVSIPAFFLFNIEMHGYQKIKSEESSKSQNFTLSTSGSTSQSVMSVCRILDFIVEDIPAVKEENFVWCTSDFTTRVSFELQGTNFGVYKPFAKSWKEIEELLEKDSDFGDKLKMENPYREELLSIIRQNEDQLSRVRAIFSFVKSKIKWNNKYGFYGGKVKTAIKEGVGTNAEINFVLLSMLKEAGVRAYPVLLSERDHGRLPFTYASISKLTTFIIGFYTISGEKAYIDGSAVNGDVNVLPPSLLVDKAREYGVEDANAWVDLTGISSNRMNLVMDVSFSPDNQLVGKSNFTYRGQFSYQFKNRYFESGDSLAFKEKRQAELGVNITKQNVTGIDSLSSVVQESLAFSKQAYTSDNHIYLPAMLFPHITENPFTNKERMFPIEFSYPYQFRISCSLRIPEGYEVEEIPKPLKLTLSEGGCLCSYMVGQQENNLIVSYNFVLNRILYSQPEYADLQKMWEMVIAKNTEQIVLKKL